MRYRVCSPDDSGLQGVWGCPSDMISRPFLARKGASYRISLARLRSPFPELIWRISFCIWRNWFRTSLTSWG